MDPGRIHSYLQAACAGLGFDIGEVWFAAVDKKNSKLTSIEHRIGRGSDPLEQLRSIKFLQLYTSKSYGDTDDLIKPETEEGEEVRAQRKHVLSPTLVNAIATNAQVVWANCQKQEGLLGKSDMRLQTAVGMPVAMDCYGNMCIVVMFSLRSVQSTKEAMEFIKLISQGAASSKIPCLLPVVDSSQKKLAYNPQRFREWQKNEAYSHQLHAQRNLLSELNKQNVSAAVPKDSYGIPKLPDFAQLLTESDNNNNFTQRRLSFLENGSEASNEDFDNTTFGVWSTIMNNSNAKGGEIAQQEEFQLRYVDEKRRVRLEEFVTAFLGFSTFAIADVWTPVTDASGMTTLHNVFTANSEEMDGVQNIALFKSFSKSTIIKPWSGAVGRAHSTGTPVWSANPELVIDNERKNAFLTANISTVLSLPISSHVSSAPSCIICFYSLVKTDSSTFVMKFLQQALHTLWEGLETVDPHESIDAAQWQGVSASDIGEMAADVELQRALYNRKRTHELMNDNSATNSPRVQTKRQQRSSLVVQLQALPGDSAIKDAIDSPSSFSLASDDLLTLQNIAAVQKASTQQLVTNPNFFLDDPKSYVDSINAMVQQDGDQTQRIGNTRFGLDSSPFCMPVNTQSKQVPSLPNLSNTTTTSKSSKTKQKVCRIEGCNEASISRRPYCSRHSGNRLCEFAGGCSKCAQGATRFCIAHGGGRRCTFPGCDKGARDKFFCASHGGGKRCSMEGCKKSAVGGSKLCTSHGGGRRCSIEGCTKSAQSSTKFCVKHGGGKKCAQEGCDKVARGRTLYCAGHGGGVRCKLDGCNRIAVGKLQLCRAHGGGSAKAKGKKGEQVNELEGSQSYIQQIPPSSILYPM